MPGYHHGDLRSALIRAGLDLARHDGVDALGMRELTRAVGVSPNAAYRHFPSHHALVLTVADAAQQQLSRSILEAMATAGRTPASPDRAVARLEAFCLAYIGFAIAEPGWFALTCHSQEAPPTHPGAQLATTPPPPPHQLLLEALDAMVLAGTISPHRRVDAEWACWSAAHGLAVLATSGPLQSRSSANLLDLALIVTKTVIAGLRA